MRILLLKFPEILGLGVGLAERGQALEGAGTGVGRKPRSQAPGVPAE